MSCSAQVLIAICQLSALCVECGCIIFRAIEGASWSHSSSLPSDLHVMRSPFPSPPPSPSGGAVNHLKCSKGRCRGGDTPVMHAIFDTAQASASVCRCSQETDCSVSAVVAGNAPVALWNSRQTNSPQSPKTGGWPTRPFHCIHAADKRAVKPVRSRQFGRKGVSWLQIWFC